MAGDRGRLRIALVDPPMTSSLPLSESASRHAPSPPNSGGCAVPYDERRRRGSPGLIPKALTRPGASVAARSTSSTSARPAPPPRCRLPPGVARRDTGAARQRARVQPLGSDPAARNERATIWGEASSTPKRSTLPKAALGPGRVGARSRAMRHSASAMAVPMGMTGVAIKAAPVLVGRPVQPQPLKELDSLVDGLSWS